MSNKNMICCMNPPYGKSSSLSKKILNKVHESGIASEIVCLAPPKTFIDIWEKMQQLKGPYRLAKYFDVPEGNDLDLYISAYVKGSTKKFELSIEEALMTKKQLEYFEAVKKYNEKNPNHFEYLLGLNLKKKELYSKYEEEYIFEIPIYTPANGVELGGQTGEHNREGKAIRWGNSGPYGIYTGSKTAFDNFSKWYYSFPYSFSRRKRDTIKCVLDLALSILLNVWGAAPSILKYDFVLPHLDWSKEWDDNAILAELKLPPDFLEH